MAMCLTSSRGKAPASNSSARDMVELMLSEYKAHEKAQICVEVACTKLFTSLVLVLVKHTVHNIKHIGMEDYALCDNRAQAKPSTDMEVVGIKYTEPKFGEQSGPGLEEDSARAVKMFT